MLARTIAVSVAFVGLVLAAPSSWAPIDDAAAYCWQIEGVDDCFNPCDAALGPYQFVRETVGHDVGPDPACPE